MTFEERAVHKTDWRGWEMYVYYKKITEYGFLKPIMLNAPGALKNVTLTRNKLLKIWNSTQRSRRINIWEASIWFQAKMSLATTARTVYIKSLGPNDSDWLVNGRWSRYFKSRQCEMECGREREKVGQCLEEEVLDRLERFLFKFYFSRFFVFLNWKWP